MLISTRLDLLGDLLRSDKATMHTKGVASVRSPVCNLRQFKPSVDHLSFVDAVVATFRKEYGIDDKIRHVEDSEDTRNVEYIRNGMAELPSWDWAYGQTPEFTHAVHHSFEWGDLVAEIHSRHGIILSCVLTLPEPIETSLARKLRAMAGRLEQQKYGFIDNSALGADMREDEVLRDVWRWLRTEMDS